MTDLPTGGAGDDDWTRHAPLFAELQKLMSSGTGPVNWDLARQLAVSQIGAADAPVTAEDRSQISDALRLADTWLDPHATFPSGVRVTAAWRRLDWVEKTLPSWATLANPLAERVVASMNDMLGGTLEMPEEARAQLGPLTGMMQQAGGLMFGAQVGQGVAQLAADVLSSTEIGLPLGPEGEAALLPANITAFGQDLDQPLEEVRLYLALREVAHHRLFAHVPWLRGHLAAAVSAYADGISIDGSALRQAMTQVDPSNPESLSEALAGGMFTPEDTPQQRTALARLETMLALVEGWVDDVVTAAATALPGASALGETLRRRRASGGPAEQTFATLVGLELRPRRLREAAALWSAVRQARGIEGRDALWEHPDLLPVADDLADPEAYAERTQLVFTVPDDLSELLGDSPEDKPDDPGTADGGSPGPSAG